MIILIGGETHSGKTALARTAVTLTGFSCLSIDHLKMGLIRAGYTNLTALSPDKELTVYLWPVVREMIKTAIENSQNMIMEGCYIPATWREDFPKDYSSHVASVFLVMTERYITHHYRAIADHSCTIEQRGANAVPTQEELIKANATLRARLDAAGEDYILIDTTYPSHRDMLKQALGEPQH